MYLAPQFEYWLSLWTIFSVHLVQSLCSTLVHLSCIKLSTLNSTLSNSIYVTLSCHLCSPLSLLLCPYFILSILFSVLLCSFTHITPQMYHGTGTQEGCNLHRLKTMLYFSIYLCTTSLHSSACLLMYLMYITHLVQLLHAFWACCCEQNLLNSKLNSYWYYIGCIRSYAQRSIDIY